MSDPRSIDFSFLQNPQRVALSSRTIPENPLPRIVTDTNSGRSTVPFFQGAPPPPRRLGSSRQTVSQSRIRTPVDASLPPQSSTIIFNPFRSLTGSTLSRRGSSESQLSSLSANSTVLSGDGVPFHPGMISQAMLRGYDVRRGARNADSPLSTPRERLSRGSSSEDFPRRLQTPRSFFGGGGGGGGGSAVAGDLADIRKALARKGGVGFASTQLGGGGGGGGIAGTSGSLSFLGAGASQSTLSPFEAVQAQRYSKVNFDLVHPWVPSMYVPEAQANVAVEQPKSDNYVFQKKNNVTDGGAVKDFVMWRDKEYQGELQGASPFQARNNQGGYWKNPGNTPTAYIKSTMPPQTESFVNKFNSTGLQP